MKHFAKILTLWFITLLIISPTTAQQDENTDTTPPISASTVTRIAPIKLLGTGALYGIVYSPDGAYIAIHSDIGLWLYDANDMTQYSFFPGNAMAIAFSADSQWLASGGDMLRVWDIKTGEVVQTIVVEKAHWHQIAFNSDDSQVVAHLVHYEDVNFVVALDNSIGIWDVATGAQLQSFQSSLLQLNNDATYVIQGMPNAGIRFTRLSDGATIIRDDLALRNFMPIDSTGDLIIYRQRVGDTWVTDMRTGDDLLRVEGHFYRLSADGAYLAVVIRADDATSLEIWHIPTATLERTIPLPPKADELHIRQSITFSPDGRWIVVVTTTAEAVLIDTTTWQVQTINDDLVQNLYVFDIDFSFSPDSNYLLYTIGTPLYEMQQIRIFDIARGEVLFEHHSDVFYLNNITYSPDNGYILSSNFRRHITYLRNTALLWSASGEHIATLNHIIEAMFSQDSAHVIALTYDEAQEQYVIRLHDVTTGALVSSRLVAIDPLQTRFIPQHHLMLTWDEQGVITITDPITGDGVLTIDTGISPLNGVATVGDFIFYYSDDRVTIVSMTDGGLLAESARNWVSISPDGRFVVLRPHEYDPARDCVLVQDIPSGQPRFCANEYLSYVVISPDATHIIGQTDDDVSIVWDALTGEQRFTLNGLSHIRFTPDSTLIVGATTHPPYHLVFVDATTGETVHRLETMRLSHFTFSPDGQYLFTTTWSAYDYAFSTGQIWRIAP